MKSNRSRISAQIISDWNTISAALSSPTPNLNFENEWRENLQQKKLTFKSDQTEKVILLASPSSPLPTLNVWFHSYDWFSWILQRGSLNTESVQNLRIYRVSASGRLVSQHSIVVSLFGRSKQIQYKSSPNRVSDGKIKITILILRRGLPEER